MMAPFALPEGLHLDPGAGGFHLQQRALQNYPPPQNWTGLTFRLLRFVSLLRFEEVPLCIIPIHADVALGGS